MSNPKVTYEEVWHKFHNDFTSKHFGFIMPSPSDACKYGYDSRQPEIDAYREALKQCAEAAEGIAAMAARGEIADPVECMLAESYAAARAVLE